MTRAIYLVLFVVAFTATGVYSVQALDEQLQYTAGVHDQVRHFSSKRSPHTAAQPFIY